MTKNSTKEDELLEKPAKNSHFLIYGGIILLLCLGLCISYDLHQTKEISSIILPRMQAEYEAKIADLSAEIELLKRDFHKLNSEHLSLDTLSEKYIDEKLAEFEKNLIKGEPKNQEELVLQNNTRISALEKTVEAIKDNEKNIPQEILLGAGALSIRNMADNGENFAYEAEVLQILACGNQIAEEYIAKIRQFSSQPLQTKSSLIKNFKRIYADLSGTEINSSDNDKSSEDVTEVETWKNAFFARIKNLITFKHKKSVKFEPLPDEVYDLVESGNLFLALQRMQTDKKYAVLNYSALEAWKHDVQNYLEFNSAVEGLLMNTLANIHLKQFERNQQK